MAAERPARPAPTMRMLREMPALGMAVGREVILADRGRAMERIEKIEQRFQRQIQLYHEADSQLGLSTKILLYCYSIVT
jgi:hypothetical protein